MRFRWTKELLALLGVLPDSAVAAKAGLTGQSVAAERRRRGIAPARPRRAPIEWTQDMIALLGKVSDSDVAEVVGLCPSRVWHKRHILGIPAFRPNPPPIQWTPAMIERLGKEPDSRVAEELGVSVSSVLAKRRALGIPATRESLPVERNEEAAELLRLPNAEVLHRTGLEWATILRLREDLGIPEPTFQIPETPADARADEGAGHDRSGAEPRAASAGARFNLPADWRNNYRWSPEDIALLGSGIDAEIAAHLGRSLQAVYRKRRGLGIGASPQTPARRWTPPRRRSSGRLPTPRSPVGSTGASKRWQSGDDAWGTSTGDRLAERKVEAGARPGPALGPAQEVPPAPRA